MKKIIFLMLFIYAFAFTTIKPYKFIRFNNYISKIAYNQKYLIAGLENGSIVIKDFKTLKTLYSINLPKIHDFMGDLISMPIFSLDISQDSTKLLILTEGENSKRELFVFNLKTHKLTHIFTTKKTLMKAQFIDNKKIIFGVLSDEVGVYDLSQNKWEYVIQAGNYVFSTFALNNNKTKIAIGDESGAIKIIDVINGKKIKTIKGFNKDKTLSIDYQKNLIINASSDMRVAIYNENGNEKLNLKVKFLPYAAAISPNIDAFAIQYDEKNDILIYSIYKKQLFKLSGHTMPLNGMKYLNEKEIISFSPAEIIIWKLKEK